MFPGMEVPAMIAANYHTHTARCGHAVGSDEEYVRAAIRGGLTTLGFSDHAAYRTPHPGERMNFEEVPGYLDSIRGLRKKYAGKIRILLGMEVENYTSEWTDLVRYRKELDYCILGQHNLSIDADSCYDVTEPAQLKRYVDLLEDACVKDLCDCIAHPDVILYSWPRLDGSVREAAARIADISLKYDVPLELNCGGVRRGRRDYYEDGPRYPYPVRPFFEEFARRGCKILVGLDIHDPALFETDEMIHRAFSVVEGLSLNILDDYPIEEAARQRKARIR